MGELRELYERVQDVAPADRAAWLEANCTDADLRRRVTALLDAGRRAGDPLAGDVRERLTRLAPDDADVPAAHWLGRRVGAFRIERLLGQGGMAVVFEARRADADFEQAVALKLLKRGIFSELEERLFRRERRALAALAHPNIARLVDGGVADDGTAYLALELVDGAPITTYCTARGLGTRARLQLFADVCRAVEAAHQSLIVHRDIKPSNILVTPDGTPKLLDFGIAKLLDDDASPTQSGLAALTPDYAAPEQFHGGPITTATDVYALGVLLHELVFDARPPAGGVRTRRGGDLDNVLDKALAAEPERRYGSAGALADDVARHLAGLPVEAHPPSAWYRTRKFVQRHRGAVAVSLAMLVAVLASLAIAIWQAREARLQAELARAEAARAAAVQEFLLGLFEASEPGRPLDELPDLRDILARGAQRARNADNLTPSARIAVLQSIGRVNRALGRLDDATALLEDADRLRTEHGASALERAAGQVDLAALEQRRARYREALARLDALDPVLLQSDPKLALRALSTRADAELGLGRPQAALPLLEQAVALADRLHAAPHPETAGVLVVHGHALFQLGRYDDALAVAQRTLAIQEALHGPEHTDVASALSEIGTTYGELQRCDASLAAHERAVAIDRKVWREPNRRSLLHLQNLAVDAGRCGDLGTAANALRNAHAGYARQLGPTHQSTLVAAMNLAGASRELGDVDAARRALADARAAVAAGAQVHAELPMALTTQLGETELAAGSADAALALYAEGTRAWAAHVGKDHRRIAAARIGWAEAAVSTGHVGVADEQLALVAGFLAGQPDLHALRGEHARVAALLALRRGALDTARSQARIAVDALETAQPGHPRTVRAALLAARIELDAGRPDAARPLLDRAAAIAGERLPDTHPARAELAALEARMAR